MFINVPSGNISDTVDLTVSEWWRLRVFSRIFEIFHHFIDFFGFETLWAIFCNEASNTETKFVMNCQNFSSNYKNQHWKIFPRCIFTL